MSDQKLIEHLLKPKSNGKVSIAYMVSTSENVQQIEVRPPTLYFNMFQATGNKTPFLQAKVISTDCNMILCEWRGDLGQTHSEWVFKGSPQIMKLFSKFDQSFLGGFHLVTFSDNFVDFFFSRTVIDGLDLIFAT